MDRFMVPLTFALLSGQAIAGIGLRNGALPNASLADAATLATNIGIGLSAPATPANGGAGGLNLPSVGLGVGNAIASDISLPSPGPAGLGGVAIPSSALGQGIGNVVDAKGAGNRGPKTTPTALQSRPIASAAGMQAGAKGQGTKSQTASSSTASTALNAQASDCFVKLPNNFLTAEGLATPIELQPPCSMQVSTQQAFAEAAVFDPTTNTMSIYHPLIIDAGKKPATAPVVPKLPSGAVVAMWFGFNGNTLQLLDTNGADANTSPSLKSNGCVNGLPGTKGDVFGQVSWCNTQPFFNAANAAVSSGNFKIPALGTDKNGEACPSSRSFKIVDACPSDNVPTQYLLLSDGTTVQDTAANRQKYPSAQVINNASDEALLANIIDPVIGCTPFLNPSLDNPGEMVPSLAGDELQAGKFQQAPIGLVPINDPDCLLTSSGAVSPAKTNAYRAGVNQALLGNADNGALQPYCNSLVQVAPSFFQGFKAAFSGQTSPDTGVGNNLFTFLCNRYLQSLQQLKCPTVQNQPVQCTLDGNGAATACTITTGGTTGGKAGTSGTPTTMATTTKGDVTGGTPPATAMNGRPTGKGKTAGGKNGKRRRGVA